MVVHRKSGALGQNTDDPSARQEQSERGNGYEFPLGFRKFNPLRSSILSARIARLALLPLRLIVGYGFAEHGVGKLLRGPDNFTGIFHAMGMPFPHLLAWLTISTDVTDGARVLAGALRPIVRIPMAIVFLVAIFTVHLRYGFSSSKLQGITRYGRAFWPTGV